MDGSKDKVQGISRNKCIEAGMNVEKIEPQTPWSNYFEGAIRDLKKGTGLEMLWSGASKMIWDDCLKQEALIRSHTAHDIYGINNDVCIYDTITYDI